MSTISKTSASQAALAADAPRPTFQRLKAYSSWGLENAICELARNGTFSETSIFQITARDGTVTYSAPIEIRPTDSVKFVSGEGRFLMYNSTTSELYLGDANNVISLTRDLPRAACQDAVRRAYSPTGVMRLTEFPIAIGFAGNKIIFANGQDIKVITPSQGDLPTVIEIIKNCLQGSNYCGASILKLNNGMICLEEIRDRIADAYKDDVRHVNFTIFNMNDTSEKPITISMPGHCNWEKDKELVRFVQIAPDRYVIANKTSIFFYTKDNLVSRTDLPAIDLDQITDIGTANEGELLVCGKKNGADKAVKLSC